MRLLIRLPPDRNLQGDSNLATGKQNEPARLGMQSSEPTLEQKLAEAASTARTYVR